MIGTIISAVIIGLIAGFLARALVPGRDPMGIGQTLLLGLVGSFIGGLLGALLFGKDAAQGLLQPSGIIGSVFGAVIALIVYRRVTRRSHTRSRV